ncbi:hypothetical protein LCGC14_0378020 [marine sediment metagenome]|uniref:Uncharacterized protein n=1 Tax=marine sediment metagenome TaxID=412755 RepID=A0A0F9T915_9ZZZZ
MKTKEIQNISAAINCTNHFLEFSPCNMTILYGLSEIMTSDDTMMKEIKDVFERQKSKLERQLAQLLGDFDD